MKYEFTELDDFVSATKDENIKWIGIALLIEAEEPFEGVQKVGVSYLLTAGIEDNHLMIQSNEFPKGKDLVVISGAYLIEERKDSKLPTLKDFELLKNQGKQELVDFVHDKYPKVKLFNGRVLP